MWVLVSKIDWFFIVVKLDAIFFKVGIVEFGCMVYIYVNFSVLKGFLLFLLF